MGYYGPGSVAGGYVVAASAASILATASALDFNPTPEDVNVPVTLWTVPVGKRARVTDIVLREWNFGGGPPYPIGDSIRVVFGWNGARDVAGWQTEEAGQFPGTSVHIALVTPEPESDPPVGMYVPVVEGVAGDTFDLTFTRETGGDPLTVTVDVVGYLLNA
jgi:hypothetical protein